MKKQLLSILSIDDLFRMARDGDREAFGEVIVRWEIFIRRTLVETISHPEDREDAFQYIALALMTEIENVKHDNFQGWMRLVIKCRRYDFLRQAIYKTRKLRAEQEITGYDFSMNCDEGREDDPALICERLEIQHDIRKAVNCLPIKQREAVQDVCLDGKTQQKAAKGKGITDKGIASRLRKAEKSLRNSLTQYQHPLT